MSKETKIENRKRNSKKRKKKKSAAARVIIITIIVIVVIVAAFFGFRIFFKCTAYDVLSTVDITNDETDIEVQKYRDGYVKCAGNGLTYFNRTGVIWSDALTLTQPIMDIAGSYIAVSDKKSTEVFLYDENGLVNSFAISAEITDVEVSRFGTVAVASKNGSSDFIELMDRDGNDLVNVKTVFSSTGNLSDISMSSDGARLAACFVGVKGASVVSKVVFYDFSKNANAGENLITGTFDDFKQTLLTTVEFVNDSKVVAVGDNVITVYDASDTPEVFSEIRDFPYEIQSLFFDSGHVGMVVNNSDGEEAYAIKVYNLSLRQIFDQPFNYNYSKAGFTGSGVYLYSDYDLDVYNYFGVYKFSGTLDVKISHMASLNDGISFIYMTEGDTKFIRLR